MKCPLLQGFFLATEFVYGNYFTIEGRQKTTFKKSELGVLLPANSSATLLIFSLDCATLLYPTSDGTDER